MKTHHFHTKLTYQKPMLRQIEWWVQNGPIKKNGVLPVTSLLFWKFCFSLRTSYRMYLLCWLDVPTTQMSIFDLFVSAGVLFDVDFSLWASLTLLDPGCIKFRWGNLKRSPFWNGSTLWSHILWLLVFRYYV